jgi:hypothetical protein
VNAETERIFSVLVGLDPLGPTAEADRGAATVGVGVGVGVGGLNEADRIAHIISRPRYEPTPARSTTRTLSPGARNRPHLRAGAVGLVASAAIAALAMLVWASPSAGESTDRSIDLPTQESPGHGPLPVSVMTAARA